MSKYTSASMRIGYVSVLLNVDDPKVPKRSFSDIRKLFGNLDEDRREEIWEKVEKDWSNNGAKGQKFEQEIKEMVLAFEQLVQKYCENASEEVANDLKREISKYV